MKKPRHVSDEVAEAILQEAGTRSVSTAVFATSVVAFKRQHGKVSGGKETSVEEATRKFWQRTLGMDTDDVHDTASPDESRVSRHQYPASLRPTIRVLSRMCEQVISDEQGEIATQHYLPHSQSNPAYFRRARTDSQKHGQILSCTGLDGEADAPRQQGILLGASSVKSFNGAVGYIAAMRKARNQPVGPLDTCNPQAETFLTNQTVKAFLARLRQHSSQITWETDQSHRAHSPNTIARQQSCWQVGKAATQAPAVTRPWVVLAGPAFAPDYFAASGEPEESAALEELKKPRTHLGPDVSHLSRPSDKIAFEQQNEGRDNELPPIRKTLADLFETSVLTKLPPKIMYSGKAMSNIDSLRSLSHGQPVFKLEPSRQRSRHAHMMAHMKKVEAAALSNQPSSLHLLVMKAEMNGDCAHRNAKGQRSRPDVPDHETPIMNGLPCSQGFRCSEI